MADLRRAAPAWTFWLVLALPLAGAQPEAACSSPEASGGAAPAECQPSPQPALSPLDVLLSGGGILGSLLLLRKGPTAPS
ncbi:MAG: hypothetical protein LC623_09435 [Halobacteriales archaeon]|nr:hypothetical protein [Halobacteriales archaeon]